MKRLSKKSAAVCRALAAALSLTALACENRIIQSWYVEREQNTVPPSETDEGTRLSAPEVTWESSTEVTWTPVDNAVGYKVKLFKDEGDVPVAQRDDLGPAVTSYDFKNDMITLGAGEYTVSVTAIAPESKKEDILYLDSPSVKPKESKPVFALDPPVNLSWDVEKGIASWGAVSPPVDSNAPSGTITYTVTLTRERQDLSGNAYTDMTDPLGGKPALPNASNETNTQHDFHAAIQKGVNGEERGYDNWGFFRFTVQAVHSASTVLPSPVVTSPVMRITPLTLLSQFWNDHQLQAVTDGGALGTENAYGLALPDSNGGEEAIPTLCASWKIEDAGFVIPRGNAFVIPKAKGTEEQIIIKAGNMEIGAGTWRASFAPAIIDNDKLILGSDSLPAFGGPAPRGDLGVMSTTFTGSHITNGGYNTNTFTFRNGVARISQESVSDGEDLTVGLTSGQTSGIDSYKVKQILTSIVITKISNNPEVELGETARMYISSGTFLKLDGVSMVTGNLALGPGIWKAADSWNLSGFMNRSAKGLDGKTKADVTGVDFGYVEGIPALQGDGYQSGNAVMAPQSYVLFLRDLWNSSYLVDSSRTRFGSGIAGATKLAGIADGSKLNTVFSAKNVRVTLEQDVNGGLTITGESSEAEFVLWKTAGIEIAPSGLTLNNVTLVVGHESKAVPNPVPALYFLRDGNLVFATETAKVSMETYYESGGTFEVDQNNHPIVNFTVSNGTVKIMGAWNGIGDTGGQKDHIHSITGTTGATLTAKAVIGVSLYNDPNGL
ncbi:MAG: hypothetical protein LBR16_00415 [Treponema sp.]|jgi:hypothetical protein|nr:hypothetical protein [Treponema sp.]